MLYHRASHNCLLQAIEQMLAPDGECWIGDPGRVNAREFFHWLSRSFEVHLYDRDGREFWVPQVGDYQRFTLRHVAHQRHDAGRFGFVSRSMARTFCRSSGERCWYFSAVLTPASTSHIRCQTRSSSGAGSLSKASE